MSKATGRLIDFDPFSVMSECDLLPHHGNLKKLFSPPVEIRTITLRGKRDSDNSGIKINGHFRKPARNYEDIFWDTFKIEKGMSQTAIINRFRVKLCRKGKAFVFSEVCVRACNNGELGLAARKITVLRINIQI